MAIRKDLDDMLNNLKGSADAEMSARPAHPAPAPVHRPTKAEDKINHMSVDDLLSSLTHEQAAPPSPAESAPAKAAPVQAEAPKKKRIVISGELPDYEAIRRADLEKDRAEAERKAVEEAKQKLIEAERRAAEKKAAEEAERARIEAERRAAEEAERARIEAERRAAEEAERARIEAEKRAAEEAERARIEAERRAAEKAERARIEAERRAAEEAERARIEAERRAAEEAERARIEAERKAAEEAAAESAPYSFEEEMNVVTSSRTEDSLGGEPSVDELMAAAFAAVKAENETDEPETEEAEPAAEAEQESDPVGNMIETIREDAEKKLSDLEKPAEEETPAEEEASEENDDEPADKSEERKKRFFSRKKENDEAAESAEEQEKPKGKLTSTLEKIMDEDPEEIIAERSEKTEEDDGSDEPQNGKLKKRLYTVFGVVFAVLACVGLITVIAKSIDLFSSFTSGSSKKSGFADVVYPAVIMDIESFDDPTQLTSDQVITAAIWSMIMTDGTLDQYEKTFDVVRVPAVDVESYAVKLFGDDLPELTHTTVGPAESRFYYNEEKESYNVPLTPVTFTYAPEIKSVTKNGSDYTVDVDYVDELPEWLPKTSSKSVQFKLKETSEGYQIKSMKVLSENNNI
ncbi:MAG: hypothetical protein IKP42_00950 [Ruminococcus sp.]|nr:hypothetical protein [Ruminococcus sp.]